MSDEMLYSSREIIDDRIMVTVDECKRRDERVDEKSEDHKSIVRCRVIVHGKVGDKEDLEERDRCLSSL